MLLVYYYFFWFICFIFCVLIEDMKIVYFFFLVFDSKLVNKRIRESVSNLIIVYKIEIFVIFILFIIGLKIYII